MGFGSSLSKAWLQCGYCNRSVSTEDRRATLLMPALSNPPASSCACDTEVFLQELARGRQTEAQSENTTPPHSYMKRLEGIFVYIKGTSPTASGTTSEAEGTLNLTGNTRTIGLLLRRRCWSDRAERGPFYTMVARLVWCANRSCGCHEEQPALVERPAHFVWAAPDHGLRLEIVRAQHIVLLRGRLRKPARITVAPMR